MKNRHAGMLIIGIALLIGFLIWLFNKTLSRIVNENCSHGASCAMWDSIRFQTGVGIGLLVLVLLVGIYIAFFAKDNVNVREIHRIKIIKDSSAHIEGKEQRGKKEKDILNKKAESLEGDEKVLFEIILRSEGSVFQSQIIKETGFTKVRVTRILDRLEGKGIIERKRRGMTNVVLLRH